MPVPKTPKEPQPVETPSQADYVSGKISDLLSKVAGGYGKSLQQELMDRLERTIAEFHDEVTELIAVLKERSQQRQAQLHELWEQRESVSPQEEEEEEESPRESAEPGSDSGMSEWEKRLERLSGPRAK